VVLGVSGDTVKKHASFKAKYKLPFTLLADTYHAIGMVLGVCKNMSLWGINYLGIERTS
jgi:peroxiredoxin Q/BCP